jgi:hypothetical protein
MVVHSRDLLSHLNSFQFVEAVIVSSNPRRDPIAVHSIITNIFNITIYLLLFILLKTIRIIISFNQSIHLIKYLYKL